MVFIIIYLVIVAISLTACIYAVYDTFSIQIKSYIQRRKRFKEIKRLNKLALRYLRRKGLLKSYKVEIKHCYKTNILSNKDLYEFLNRQAVKDGRLDVSKFLFNPITSYLPSMDTVKSYSFWFRVSVDFAKYYTKYNSK